MGAPNLSGGRQLSLEAGVNRNDAKKKTEKFAAKARQISAWEGRPHHFPWRHGVLGGSSGLLGTPLASILRLRI